MTQNNPTNDLKLVWCSPHPNHYNGYLFDHLAVLPGVDFVSIYFKKTIIKYPWISPIQAEYSVSYLNKKYGIDFGFLHKRWKSKNELLVIAGWNEPTMIILLTMLMMSGRKFILVTDTPRIRPINSVREFLRKVFLDKVFENTYRFFVTGKPGIERAKLLGIPESKLVNFPFATHVDFFIPLLNKKYDNRSLLFISSGRLDNAHKGYDIALKAFHKIKQLHPNLLFKYCIAGEGPDREVLQALIHTYGLSAEVELKGWLEIQDLLSFYQSGDIFLHPSHEDPFPNAVLEAMSCGLPVIGSNAAGSVRDRVVDGENGYSHKENDIEDLCQKIIKMTSFTSVELESFSQQARVTALQWKVSYHQQVMQGIIEKYKQEL